MPDPVPLIQFHSTERLSGELGQLPGRARLAFAARCARRVLPLLFASPALDAGSARELYKVTGAAVALAESFAAGIDVATPTLSAIGTATRSAAFDTFSGRKVREPVAPAADAIAGAVEAAVAQDLAEAAERNRQAAEEVARKARTVRAVTRAWSDYPDGLGERTEPLRRQLEDQLNGFVQQATSDSAQAATFASEVALKAAVLAATAGVTSAHHALGVVNPREADTALSADFHQLRQWAKLNSATARAGAPPALFGPLWATDEPAWSVAGRQRIGATATPLALPEHRSAFDPSFPMTRTLQYEPVADRSASEPLFEEIHAEWCRYHRALEQGRIDPRLVGQFVAFFDGRVADADADATVLRLRAADALGVHPDRLVIAFFG